MINIHNKDNVKNWKSPLLRYVIQLMNLCCNLILYKALSTIIVGGMREKYLLQIAAKHANIYNSQFKSHLQIIRNFQFSKNIVATYEKVIMNRIFGITLCIWKNPWKVQAKITNGRKRINLYAFLEKVEAIQLEHLKRFC